MDAENDIYCEEDILIVDDSKEHRALLIELLKNVGFKIRSAENGELALGSVNAKLPSLILLDIKMPGMDGFEVCKRLKADETTKDIPIIFISALEDKSSKIEGFKAGGVDYITKPFKTEETLARVKTHFKLRQLQLKLGNQNEILQNEITERNRVEKKLIQAKETAEKSEKYLNNIINNMGDPVFVKDDQSRLLLVNDAFCTIFGLSRENIMGKTLAEDVTPEERESFLRIDKQVLANGQDNITEELLTVRGGQAKTISTRKTLFSDTNGNKSLVGVIRDITERKRDVEALNESQQLFQNLAQISPVGIFRTSADGNTTYVNPRWSELTGLSFEEAMGYGWINAVHPDDKELVNKKWIENNMTQQTSNAEYRFLRPDGSIIWVIGNAVPEMKDNIVKGFIGTITDITDRKLAEESLRIFKMGIDCAEDGICITDVNGTIEFANHAFEKIYGYSLSEIIGKTMRIIKSGLYSQVYYKEFWDTLLSKNIISGEIINKRKDGHLVTVDISNTPILNEKGDIIGFISINRDITDRKQEEEKYRHERYLFTMLMDNIPDHIYFKDKESRFVRMNKSMVKRFGFNDQSEAIGKTDFDVFKNEHALQAFQDELTIIRNGEPIINFEEKETWPDGSITWVSTTKSPLLDSKGQITGTFGISRDITVQKQTEIELIAAKEKAEESDRLKTSFLANMSHEIRTPLNSIIGFSELIIDPDFGTEQHAEFAQLINDQGNNLLTVLSDIMDISKIEAGQVIITKRNFSVNQVIATSQNELSPKAVKKGIELKLDPSNPNEEITIHSDKGRINQILNNLVVNAIKFTEKGVVEIGFKTAGDFVQFHVKDTGIGIQKEYHEQIFDRFKQVESSFTRNYGGNGLGLAISKNLVEMLGGVIWVESEVTLGSTFYFTVPI